MVIDGKQVNGMGMFYGDVSLPAAFDAMTEETAEHSLMRQGGFVYTNNGVLVAVRAIAASTSSLNNVPELTLQFDAGTLVDDNTPCEGGFKLVNEGWAPAEATDFCYQETASGCCQHGCFMYKFSDGIRCYPILT